MRSLIVLLIASVSWSVSWSAPTFRTMEVNGSSILVLWDNPDPTAYRCTINFDWIHDGLSAPQHYNGVTDIPSGAKDYVSSQVWGSYIGLRFYSPVSAPCAALPGPTGDPTPPPAVCTYPKDTDAPGFSCGTFCGVAGTNDTVHTFCAYRSAKDQCVEISATGSSISENGNKTPSEEIWLRESPATLCSKPLKWADGPAPIACTVARPFKANMRVLYEVRLKNRWSRLQHIGMRVKEGSSLCGGDGRGGK